MHRVSVIEAATRDVISVSPETKAIDVLEIARKTNLHSFPVVKNKKLVGIVSLKDIFKIFYPYDETFEKYRAILHSWEKIYEEYEKDIFQIHIKRETLVNTRVEEIMTTEVEIVYVNDTLKEAYQKLREGGMRILPVLSSKNEVVGVISLFDIIYFILMKVKEENGC